MTDTPGYIPSARQWVREQVELYEGSGGTLGCTTLRDTGLPVIIVTHARNKTGAIRKTPLMRVKDGANYNPRRLNGRSADQPGLGVQLACPPRGGDPRPYRGPGHACPRSR